MSHKCQISVTKYVSAFLLIAVYSSQILSFMSVESGTEIPMLDFSPNLEEVEECEKNFSNCENFTTYPSAYIEKMIKDELIKKEWFSRNGVKLTEQDMNCNNDINALCRTTCEVWHPKGKITRSGKFIYIVQMQVNDEHYYQSIRNQLCSPDDTQLCKVDNQPLPVVDESKFKCDQVKGVTTVIGITTNGEVVRDQIQSNICCSCKYVT